MQLRNFRVLPSHWAWLRWWIACIVGDVRTVYTTKSQTGRSHVYRWAYSTPHHTCVIKLTSRNFLDIRYRLQGKQYRHEDTSMLPGFGATVTSNGSPYATGPLSCLSCVSVTLAYCGQTVGWIKIPLGTEVGVGPGHIVLDGDTAPPTERGTTASLPPLFGPCLLWPNGRPTPISGIV